MDRNVGISAVGSMLGANETKDIIEEKLYSEEEVHDMDKHGVFEPIPEERKQCIYKIGSERFGLRSFSRKVCAVCDSLWPCKDINQCEVRGNNARKWVSRLKGLEDVPEANRREYDVSSWLPHLKGALLSPRGLVVQSDGEPCGLLQVCDSCYTSLKSRSNRPPKFAIANGFDVGSLPLHLTHASLMERQMTSVSSIAASITILRGGRHKEVRGHVTVVTLDPGAISKRLPELLRGKQDFFVIMASKMTSKQKLLAMRKYRARREVIHGLLEFYVNNNIMYQNIGVQIDGQALDSLNDGEEGDASVSFEELNTSNGSKEGAEESEVEGIAGSQKKAAQNSEGKYVEESFLAVRGDDNTTVEILDAAREVLAVRNHGKLILDFDNELLGLSFQDLFPRGRGHPGTKRQVKVSFEECIRYYLRISSRRFCQHPTFAFVAFDICGKRRVVTSTTVRSRHRPEEFEKIGTLTRDEVVAAIEEKGEQRKKLIRGERSNDSKLHGSAVPGRKLLQSVFVSQTSMWGSSAERLTYRRRGFCMDAYFKSGAIFVTITPNDGGTMVVSVLVGCANIEEVESIRDGAIPSRASRAEVAMRDPVACAEYFEAICEGFFEVIVGFDLKKRLPYRGGGLFGVVKAFFGTIETQSSGTLHMHSILYVAGLPRRSSDFVKRCADMFHGPRFKETFIAFVDSVVGTSVPACPGGRDEISCPLCKAKGGIRPVEKISKAAYRMRSASQKPVPTATCDICESTFGATEILRYQVQTLHERAVRQGYGDVIPLGATARESDRLTENFTSIPTFLPRSPVKGERITGTAISYSLRLSQMILLTQQHNSCHVLSCFKKNSISSSGECRYLFPRVGGMETNVGAKHKLEIGRKFHHEYINPFNEVILSLVCSNHDVRFLIGSGTTDALYYCMKYLTKTPPDVECLDVLALSYFERRKKIEEERKSSGVPYTSRSCGASRVKSIALAMSKMQQIAATMCAVYLRRHSGMFASHDFVPFHLGQTMCILEREEYEAVLVTGDEKRMVQATQLNDYLYRPEIMNCMSMIDFITSYERVRNRRIEKVNLSVEASFMKDCGLIFSEGHPLRATHSLRKRPVTVVPDIIGPRLPDRTELQSDYERERFGLVAMVLTKPFTRKKPIREEDTTFWDAFLAFEISEEMTEFRRIYLENFQEYYVSKAEAAEERKILGNRTYENEEEEDLWDRHSSERETGGDGVGSDWNEFGTPAVTQALNGVSFSMSPSNRAVVNSAETASCLNMIATSQDKKLNENIIWPGKEEPGTEEAYCSDAYAAEIIEARMKVLNSRRSGQDEAATKDCSEQLEVETIRNDEALELSQIQTGTSVEFLDRMADAAWRITVR